jgi:ketosteroid isomerase-like protein
MVEEHDVVVAEGAIRVKRKDGSFLNAVFCDAFAMKNGKVKRLTTYLTG